MDEDWHAICQAILQGVEGSETMHYNLKELHHAVKCKKSGVSKNAKALWSLKDKGIDCVRSGQCAEDSKQDPKWGWISGPT